VVGTLRSVNVGLPKDVPWQGKTVFTGVFKDSAGRPDRTSRYAAGSGSVAVTTVPPPAGLWTLSLPPSALTLSAMPTRP
jgi:hypothetical protein